VSAAIETLGPAEWRAGNERRLERSAKILLALLASRASGGAEIFDGDVETPPALAELARRFTLTAFERDLVLLAAVHARSAAFALAAPAVDFALAASLLRAPERVVLSPAASLRRWRLVEIAAGASLDRAAIRLDERVQFYLEGHSFLEPRLAGLVRPLSVSTTALPAQHALLATKLAQALAQVDAPGACPVVELMGATSAERDALFAAVCAALGSTPHVLDARELPALAAEREALARLWERETMLQNAALLIDAESTGPDHANALRGFLQTVEAPVFVAGALSMKPARGVWTVELPAREPHTDIDRWRVALGPLAAQLNGSVERTVWQFSLDDPQLAQAAAAARAVDSQNAARALWNAARNQARRGLDSLAPRVESRATWDDLVLPPRELETLRHVAVHVRERHRVYRDWGFADKSARGLGLAALFSGASGTGKTLAAEVLANELELDLHRIDLARIVSKYIGETEKNLARVFEAAEASGAVLLFDEADALFGRRSEVRDSHDRYANIEVSYLLQRIESYRGLSILTTNFRQSIDGAFLRRIRFVVQFPFPDDVARREIWQRSFPAATPREQLDYTKLARLNLAGGHIRNIALNAAFIAADRREPVRMTHLRGAAESEYAKLERALPRADVGDWA
jgi:ATPase family associated with various cellular activities (AAA)